MYNIIIMDSFMVPIQLQWHSQKEMVMQRLYHRLTGYKGNIPEVVTDNARGQNPRALSLTTDGISLYTQVYPVYPVV